jgi:hypothetical protein
MRPRQGVDVQNVRMGRTLAIAGVVALIPLLGNVVASFLTTWTGSLSWMVPPTVAVAIGMATALVQATGSAPGHAAPEPASPPGVPSPVDASPEPARRREASVGRAILVVLLVIGVGGFALTLGVRYVIGYLTGNESGTERLARPATGSAEGLTLSVESVVYTDHFTRLEVVTRNETGNSVSLPLFKNSLLVGGDGTTLEADSFRSRWSNTVAPGGVQRGTITFQGHLPDRVRRGRFGFTRVFAMGFGGPDSIFVEGIRLKRPSATT